MMSPNQTEIKTLKHAWIELTHQCDLECIHCYNESGPRKATKTPLLRHEYENLIAELKRLGCLSIQFIGGEPTIHPHLGDFIATASLFAFDRIEVFSNLTHLSSKLISAFKNSGVHVACSFYSHLPEIHDSVTRKKGSQKRTIANMYKLVAAGIPLRVGVIVVKGVNDDRLNETKTFLENMGISNIAFDDVRGVGRAQVGGASKNEILPELCGRCADGSICVDPDGNVSPCIMSRIWRMGSVRESSIDAMLTSQSWNEFSRLLGEQHVAYHGENGCSPEDQCSPGACHPQIGGPPDCMPQRSCMPEVVPESQLQYGKKIHNIA